jgi:hypothetical protein
MESLPNEPSETVGDLKSAQSVTVDGVTVLVGHTCKHDGSACEITAVWDGDDPGASLIRQSDGTPVASPVPV